MNVSCRVEGGGVEGWRSGGVVILSLGSEVT